MTVLSPILAALALWWLGTGIVFWLSERRREHHFNIGVLATAVAICATMALLPLRDLTGPGAAYAAFGLGVLLWGWHDLLFLMGFVAGPRRSPCPPGLSTGDRFLVSTQAILYHEVAILAHGVVITAFTWGGENTLAAQTFYLLWIMRILSKLVLFSGVRSLNESILPPRLRYLATYFRQGSNPVFFPVALAATVAIAIGAGHAAATSLPGSHAFIAATLLGTMAALAALEHLALILPLPDKDLWAWARAREQSLANTDTTTRRQPQ